MNDMQLEPAVLVIFGASGDLTWRMLVPALYDLFLDGWLPAQFAVYGIDQKVESEESFRQHLRQGVDAFSRHGKTDDASWGKFAPMLGCRKGDFGDAQTYTELASQLSEQDKQWNASAQRVFYLAIPPSLIELIVRQLSTARLSRNRAHARIVVEKPFGRDLDSAVALNRMLTRVFDESQIFRIDHYLGKETVQNILAFRFGNALFEPVWDRRYIDHVQITVAEQVGVEHRGGYYDHAGALRDMVQNHLLQIMCLIAMEPPVSFTADEIRNKTADVLHAIRPIPLDQVSHYAVRGQYGAGWIEGQHLPAYRSEPNVAPDSSAETFAAVKLFVDNWRWQDVPFYLRTGKRLPEKVSTACIQFRPVPHRSFSESSVMDWKPNCLMVHIQPQEGISVRFQAKQPGPAMRLSPVDMQFRYQDTFKTLPLLAYETLLLDVMKGDNTLFMRADQVEAAWSVIMPILETWESIKPVDFPNYPAGTWGPESSHVLLAQDGRSWEMPAAPPMPDPQTPRVTPKAS